MPEFRKDPIVDRWVIVSTVRSQRPSDVQLQPTTQPLDDCPFCAGQEAMTTDEVLAYRACQTAPNTPGWTVRVVPNNYPALRTDGALGGGVEGLFETRPGIGAHEVVIETPEHEAFLATLPIHHYEMRIWPKRHDSAFEQVCGQAYHHLAVIMPAVLQRTFRLLGDPPYNMIWHSAPWGDACDQYYHWHLEIMPRLTSVAGLNAGPAAISI